MDRVGKDHVRGERAASANQIIASNQHQERSGGEGRNGPSPPNYKQTRRSGKSYQICSKTECRARALSAAGGGCSKGRAAQRSKSARGTRTSQRGALAHGMGRPTHGFSGTARGPRGGSSPSAPAIVVADFVSFAATILFESPPLTRSVAPPHKMRLASLDSHFACFQAGVGVLTDCFKSQARPVGRACDLYM